MSILSLCSGYGGLELAIQATFGHQTIDAVCDNYKPARQVLTHHHPAATIHNDVNDAALHDYKSDTITFGFPCQDLSRAGKQAGLNGTRSSLFYACMNIVRAVQPTEVIVENVPQAEKYADTINQEFFDAGYTTSWARAKAHEAGLPHRRDRVFIYAHKLGRPERTAANTPTYTPTTPTFPTPTVVDMGWGAQHKNGKPGSKPRKPNTTTTTATDAASTKCAAKEPSLSWNTSWVYPPDTSPTKTSATQQNATYSAIEWPPSKDTSASTAHGSSTPNAVSHERRRSSPHQLNTNE